MSSARRRGPMPNREQLCAPGGIPDAILVEGIVQRVRRTRDERLNMDQYRALVRDFRAEHEAAVIEVAAREGPTARLMCSTRCGWSRSRDSALGSPVFRRSCRFPTHELASYSTHAMSPQPKYRAITVLVLASPPKGPYLLHVHRSKHHDDQMT